MNRFLEDSARFASQLHAVIDRVTGFMILHRFSVGDGTSPSYGELLPVRGVDDAITEALGADDE